MRSVLVSIASLFLLYMSVYAADERVNIRHTDRELDVRLLDDPEWSKASVVSIASYWSGKRAPRERTFQVRLLWSDSALFVRFDAEQHEPLIVSEKPVLTEKVRGLWDRDVCEIFIAPNRKTPNKYFEFEIAPNGEWIDLSIEVKPDKRVTDWEYSSGMTSSVRTGDKSVAMAIRIPFAALGRTPKAGDVWLGNLFRCIGKDPGRGYLAWRPTKTKQPAFHVPEAFGQFVFLK